MPNTALNRTGQALLTNKSGGALNYGDVVVFDNTTDNGFTTTTTAGLSTRGVGVILEPNGIANNASGMVALGGWCPKVNLNTAATDGQFIKTHTVAGQGTPHSSPQVEGDFAIALTAGSSPAAWLLGGPNGPSGGGAGTVTTTGTPANGNLTQFSGATSITNGDLSGDVTTSGTLVTAIGANKVTNAMLRQGGALSVIGRSANSTGNDADISAVAASDAVLRESGSTLGFGTIATAGIANSAVTLAKLANAAANSVLLGSGATGSGSPYVEIALGTNLSMSGTTLNATGGGGGGTTDDFVFAMGAV